MKTFLDLVLTGEAHQDDIDDFVDQWHEGNTSCSLAEFLGMSDDEYALWVEKPSALNLILQAHAAGNASRKNEPHKIKTRRWRTRPHPWTLSLQRTIFSSAGLVQWLSSLPSHLVQRQEQFGGQRRRISDRANLLLTHLDYSTGWPTVLPGVQEQHHIPMSQACQATACQR